MEWGPCLEATPPHPTPFLVATPRVIIILSFLVATCAGCACVLQVRGSSVLVYSEGPPMEFALVCPPEGRKPWNTKKGEYQYKAKFVCSLGTGSLYILDARDDEDFCHEAWFSPVVLKGGASVRLAFAFRWLSKTCVFHVGDGGPKKRNSVVVAGDLLAAEQKAAGARRRSCAAKRRRMLTSVYT